MLTSGSAFSFARYHSHVPYMTFSQVAAMVGGVKRLTGSTSEPGVMVGGMDETADVHPIFDLHAAIADREIDIALDRAGYETPLAALVDEKLRNAWLGTFIGLASQSSDARAKWMEQLVDAAKADLAALKAGDLEVIGAVIEDTSEQDALAIMGQLDTSNNFDLSDPWSGINRVYGNLGRLPQRWR